MCPILCASWELIQALRKNSCTNAHDAYSSKFDLIQKRCKNMKKKTQGYWPKVLLMLILNEVIIKENVNFLYKKRLLPSTETLSDSDPHFAHSCLGITATKSRQV